MIIIDSLEMLRDGYYTHFTLLYEFSVIFWGMIGVVVVVSMKFSWDKNMLRGGLLYIVFYLILAIGFGLTFQNLSEDDDKRIQSEIAKSKSQEVEIEDIRVEGNKVYIKADKLPDEVKYIYSKKGNVKSIFDGDKLKYKYVDKYKVLYIEGINTGGDEMKD